jgi:hypothetical protein
VTRTVYFGVLGELDVRRDAEIVPVATLIDRLWDEDQPVKARASVQTYVARLRRVLGVEGVVCTRPGGFRPRSSRRRRRTRRQGRRLTYAAQPANRDAEARWPSRGEPRPG